jgi:hypothetical protein
MNIHPYKYILSVCSSIYIYICAYVYACVCMHVCMHVCVCMCVCMHVCVCMCVANDVKHNMYQNICVYIEQIYVYIYNYI